jgi:hypothetical protein
MDSIKMGPKATTNIGSQAWDGVAVVPMTFNGVAHARRRGVFFCHTKIIPPSATSSHCWPEDHLFSLEDRGIRAGPEVVKG